MPEKRLNNQSIQDFSAAKLIWLCRQVITNLYYEIASKLYNLRTPQYIRTRRLGQPVNHHNRALCQGCSQGLCKQEPLQNGSTLSIDGSPPNFEEQLSSTPLLRSQISPTYVSCSCPSCINGQHQFSPSKSCSNFPYIPFSLDSEEESPGYDSSLIYFCSCSN